MQIIVYMQKQTQTIKYKYKYNCINKCKNINDDVNINTIRNYDIFIVICDLYSNSHTF